MSNLEDTRLAYEVARGSRCSDNHWYNTRRLLARHGLEVNTENVQFFAELRKSIPRSAIGIEGLLDCYKKADEILSESTQSLKGYRILEILRQYGVSPHQSTISRWFQPFWTLDKQRRKTGEINLHTNPAQLMIIRFLVLDNDNQAKGRGRRRAPKSLLPLMMIIILKYNSRFKWGDYQIMSMPT